MEDGIDTANRHLERGVIAEVDDGEGEGVGQVCASGDHKDFGYEEGHSFSKTFRFNNQIYE